MINLKCEGVVFNANVNCISVISQEVNLIQVANFYHFCQTLSSEWIWNPYPNNRFLPKLCIAVQMTNLVVPWTSRKTINRLEKVFRDFETAPVLPPPPLACVHFSLSCSLLSVSGSCHIMNGPCLHVTISPIVPLTSISTIRCSLATTMNLCMYHRLSFL